MDTQTSLDYTEAARLYGWEIADYKSQLIPAYHGNRCIEALEVSLDPLEIKAAIEFLPKPLGGSEKLRDNERLQILLGLTNFMLPLTCHVQTAVAVDAMMRQGYVGRAVNTPEHVRMFHLLGEHAHGKHFRQGYNTVCAQSSAALIGPSGMGKTSILKRFLARQKQVIYHPQYDLVQIPWLHVKMVSEGSKGMPEAIIGAVDNLLPFKNYSDKYLSGRRSLSSLLRGAGALLNGHMVGLLIVDELQNLRALRGDNSVMNDLSSLCDTVAVPILFVTTPKAKRILTQAARQMRRSLNVGFGNWNRLPEFELAYDQNGTRQTMPGEWAALVQELWKHSVLRKKRPLDAVLLSVMYECSQGIIDLTIKLFIVCEWGAILSGEEEMSESLVRQVYEDYMTVIHPLIEAYKHNDIAALLKLEDVLPFDIDACIDHMSAEFRARTNFAASTRPGQPSFMERLVQAISALGVAEEDALRLAKRVHDEHKATDMFSAMARVTEMVTPKRHRTKTRATAHADKAVRQLPDLGARPADLRHAFVAASAKGTDVVEELVGLGLVSPAIEELICLD